MISKSCKYAIRAAIYIASRADDKVKMGVKEIAKAIDAPEAFTGKLLQILNKHRIVTSLKGPYGGFFTEKPQLELPVISIVNAIDGLAVFKDCVLGLHKCSDEHPCAMHNQYAESRNSMRQSFENTSIGSLARDLNKGLIYNRNSE